LPHLPHLEDDNMNNLNEPSAVNLSGCTGVADMAQREGFDPDRYCISLAHHIRNDGVPMDVQRERLAALAQLAGGLGAEKSAEELTRHYIVLNALFDRLAMQAAKAAGQPGQASAQAAERLTAGAIKTQRAAVAVLGALTMLRQQAATPPSPALTPNNVEAGGDVVEAEQTDPSSNTW
jgi:hypothetical protein